MTLYKEDGGLHCNSCDSDFETEIAEWNWQEDDPNALCPFCGSDDVSSN